jgi:hypothetical protein
MSKEKSVDEVAIHELSGLISEWAKRYGRAYHKHIKYNSQEIDIELRLVKPEVERKLVD